MRCETRVRAYYEHLLARGKTKMRAFVASMRKLLHAIFGMLKHNHPFDGAKVYAATPAGLATPNAIPEVVCSQT
jgi:transposase